MKMDSPLFTGDKLNIPVTVVDQHCRELMSGAQRCNELHGKGSAECKDIEKATNHCIRNAIYNYVAIRKLCRREYTAWARCMDNAAENNYSPEMAESECSIYQSPLLTCGEEMAAGAAQAAMDKGILPKDIPEQK
eukprot:TRINITY_DN7327_c0_g1_i1.p1 TRINITY_DN7327_c0_g1~~TRINITY_DN7327_c0_g1_i1.p1  ORF type:complete len:135 (+),score=41.69 TRINITY_DN7327_c0_g1_i1:36-440(+)